MVRLGPQLPALTARYLAVMAADLPTLLLLLAQAPLIGLLCQRVWLEVETDTPSLWFVLVLASVWFGCINACREIVKERQIVERERLFGLSMPAYVLSKLAVLGGIALLQVIFLQAAVEWRISLRGAYLLETLALWLAAVAGTGLGLVVSAVSARQERAVAAVPLLLLPQILLSRFTVPESSFEGGLGWARGLLPVYHGFHVFEMAADRELLIGPLLWSLFVLLLESVILALLCAALLLRRQESPR